MKKIGKKAIQYATRSSPEGEKDVMPPAAAAGGRRIGNKPPEAKL